MEPVKQVEVNGRKYAVKMFGPLEAYRYAHKLHHDVAAGARMDETGLQALRQCLTETGQSLADAAVFEAYFAEHPEDLFELEAAAQEALVRPFARSRPPTSATGGN